MVEERNNPLGDRLSHAVTRMMGMRVAGERARLAVPVLYPSGASASVEVVLSGSDCFVSDMAKGQAESEMQGASSFYDHAARSSAERFGVRYDGQSIFVVRTSIDNVETAIAAVANASVSAASAAIFKSFEEKEKKKTEELFQKVTRAFSEFGIHIVTKEEELNGRDAVWPAHNVVTLPDKRKLVFEFVTENSSSVASKYFMFSDLSRSARGYSLNSVVANVDRVNAKTAMLADVSYLMQFAANDDDYRRRAIG